MGLLAPMTAAATAAPGATGPTNTTDAGRTTSVTLITGDRVVLHGGRLASVTGGPGRDDAAFYTYVRDDRVHVVPRDAAGPLAEGRLDPRLFDVTGLVEAGYDDAHRADVPLLLARDGGPDVRAAGVRVTLDLPAAGVVAAKADKAAAGDAFRALVADPAVTKVWLDGKRATSLDRSAAQINAPAAWAAGHTGKGVKVAVLDTGVDAAHPDLAGHVAQQANFTSDPDNTDGVGHGTHVASIIASNHAKYRGVAPDAQILDGKVCVYSGCEESWILAGIQWAADQGADVVNLSLGGGDTPDVDPLEAAVNRLSAEKGTLFVVAAGNAGGAGTVSSPSTADAALSVGAVARDDRLAPFSSRGPRTGDAGVKPDVTAPGVDIAAAKASAGVIGAPVDDTHVAVSGTSMATPHVAGAAALLAQQHPDWTGTQLKAALVASAKPNPDLGAYDQGAGRVDLAKAITTTLTTDPVSVGLGLQPWPHDDDVPVTRKLTYRNAGTQPVALDLSVEAKGPDGKPALAGVFAVTPAKVTVPAGGSAEVSVTGDSRAGTADGGYTGVVVTSTGLRTPVALEREVESHDLTIKYTDLDGKPAELASSLVIGLDTNVVAFPPRVGGVATARLPKGEYLVVHDVRTGDRTAYLPQPRLNLDAKTTVDVDARTAKPVRIKFPDPTARDRTGGITVDRTHNGRHHIVGALLLDGFGDRALVAQVGAPLPADQVTTSFASHAEATPVDGTPVSYRASYDVPGNVPTGFERAPAAKELAKINHRVVRGADGRTYRYGGIPVSKSGGGGATLLLHTGPTGEAVDHVLTKDVGWRWVVLQYNAADQPEGSQASGELTYRAGSEHRQRYFQPVLGPGLSPTAGALHLVRFGDEIGFGVPLWNDHDGNSGGYNTESARTTLYRDGVKVGEFPSPANGVFRVDPGAARFKIETDAVPVAGSTSLSTRIGGSWTFRSDTAPGEEIKPLPLTVVQFRPELDEAGNAPANRVLRVPLDVRQQQGADSGRVRDLTVEVSFDDGKTWTKAAVHGKTALVRNGAAGFASLRVKGSDGKGNAFEQTVIRAYRVKA
ncbi:S8 family serine peptidase [Saccharothrix obliqua]|uniref:S8 family serine peptidase n=1 Tax=Saccharothrix obliqua TaxID=2861747 RepID=UPI0027E30F59|nr:S8 family serine peptidase [Saccharothrix obliqua]